MSTATESARVSPAPAWAAAFPRRNGGQPCPLCGEREGYLIAERDRTGARLHTLLCAGCTLVRIDPLPSPEEERCFYEGLYRQSYKGGSRTRRRHCVRETLAALRRFRRLAPLLRPGMRLLDAGCGAGFFPFVLTRAGFACDGLEPDPHCVRFAQRVLGLRQVRLGRVEELVATDAYDLITLHHVLEHLRDPLTALTALRRALRPGGLLVLEVPTLADPRKPWPRAFHRAHLWWWASDTLALLAARSGFTLGRHSLDPDTGHLAAELIADRPPHAPPVPSPQAALARLHAAASKAPGRRRAAWRRSLLRIGELIGSLRPATRRGLCERLCARHLGALRG